MMMFMIAIVLAIVVLHEKWDTLPYAVRNFPNRLRGWKQELYAWAKLKPAATLRATIIRADGRVEHLGIVSRRLVTTAGVNYLASCFINTAEPEAFNFHDCGTGNTAEAVGQTALVTPFGGARVTGTQSQPGSVNIYRTVATIAFTSTLAIVEHGLFSASTVGTLWDRSVFSAINVNNGDSIQFTHETTFPNGG